MNTIFVGEIRERIPPVWGWGGNGGKVEKVHDCTTLLRRVCAVVFLVHGDIKSAAR
jgi:hypothetical protein